jgi:hypothetical protein
MITLKFIYKVIITLIIAFLIGDFFDSLSNPLYCDNGSINDFVVDRNDEENIAVDNNSPINENNIHNIAPLRFLDKIKRRVS